MPPRSIDPAADPAPVSRSTAFAVLTVAGWAALTSLALGWVPPLRYGWAYNFWQYLPPLVSPTLAVAALALCLAPVRERIIDVAQRTWRGAPRVPRPFVEPLAFVGLTGAFWLLREQQVLGDSFLLLAAVRDGYAYVFPELGATALAAAAFRLISPLGPDVLAIAQLTSCAFGAVTILVLVRACGDLGERRPGAAIPLAALVVGSGVLRIFAGHVEVYPATLMTASFYLWAALAYLDGRVGLSRPALALGVAIWMHVAALFLLPSLVALPWLAGRSTGLSQWLGDATRATVLAAVPGLAFLFWAGTLGPDVDFQRLTGKMLEILGMSGAPATTSWWVRFDGDAPAPELGIAYVFLSFAHVKYLVNAYHVLAPAGVAVVIGTLLLAPGRVRDPRALYLCSATLPLVVYSTWLRPFWGPFDWDLFALTGFFLATLGAQLVAALPSRRDFEHVVTVLIGLQLLYVGGPFVAMGASTPRPAGPFVHGSFYTEIGERGDPPHGKIAPWL